MQAAVEGFFLSKSLVYQFFLYCSFNNQKFTRYVPVEFLYHLLLKTTLITHHKSNSYTLSSLNWRQPFYLTFLQHLILKERDLPTWEI